MKLSSVERWRSSERIAEELLSSLGYTIIDRHRRIVVEGVEVGEVDLIAQDREGKQYAVEVKAGRIDVTGIRQAYVNAKLLGMEPLVVCKGFADDSAQELAKILGVQVIKLSDVFITEDEELEVIVKEAVEEALAEYLDLISMPPTSIPEDAMRILEAVYSSSSPEEAASKLGMDLPTLLRKINDLRGRGLLPRWAKKWGSIRRVAGIICAKQSTKLYIDSLLALAPQLRETANTLQKLVKSLNSILAELERVAKQVRDLQTQLQQGESHH